MNNYYKDNFNEVKYYISLVEETRQWRKHVHEHIEEATNDIMTNTDEAETAIKNGINEAETAIINELNNSEGNITAKINQAETAIKAEIDDVQTQQQNDSSIINNIWNKIRNWNI